MITCHDEQFSGTAAVVFAGLIGALRVTQKKLIENTYLFVGAGQVKRRSFSFLDENRTFSLNFIIQAACGIADLITRAMVREGASIEEARSRIWMYDVHGLLVNVSEFFFFFLFFCNNSISFSFLKNSSETVRICAFDLNFSLTAWSFCATHDCSTLTRPFFISIRSFFALGSTTGRSQRSEKFLHQERNGYEGSSISNRLCQTISTNGFVIISEIVSFDQRQYLRCQWNFTSFPRRSFEENGSNQ